MYEFSITGSFVVVTIFLFALIIKDIRLIATFVAGFNLLAAMGKAEARDLGLDGGTLYDPAVNYRNAKGSFFDWNDNPDPKPVSTRTVDTKAQSGSVTP